MRGALLLSAFAASCASAGGGELDFSSAQAGAKSICEVMADPSSHAGRRIVLKGIYFQEPHQRLLYDEACPQWDFRVSHASEGGAPRAEAIVRRFRKKHPTVRIPVVYSGIVTANVVVLGCAAPGCVRYSLEDSKLLAASPHSLPPGR